MKRLTVLSRSKYDDGTDKLAHWVEKCMQHGDEHAAFTLVYVHSAQNDESQLTKAMDALSEAARLGHEDAITMRQLFTWGRANFSSREKGLALVRDIFAIKLSVQHCVKDAMSSEPRKKMKRRLVNQNSYFLKVNSY